MATKRKKAAKPQAKASQVNDSGKGLSNNRTNMKRTFKDMVFRDLFGERENALAAFLELHPEETGVTVDDVEILTLKSVLVNGAYNDLGFKIRDYLIVLVEAQATWTPRIAVRALMYYAETLDRWLDKFGIDLYSGDVFELPATEIYVLYTGDKRDVPKDVSLKRDFPNGGRSAVEVTVKVLRGGGVGILSEYVEFTKVGDMLRKRHGYSREAAEMTVDYCILHGILKEYLTEKRIEVVDMLEELFDQERVQRIHEESLKREMNAQIREAEKKAQDQMQAKARKQALMMLEDGEPLEKIVRYTELPADYVEELARKAANPS